MYIQHHIQSMANVDTEAQPLANRAHEQAENERQEQLRHLEKELFQLANYYFVFQGVIFTSFYRAPPRLKCGYSWIPMALSALAGFLNFFAIVRISFRYKRLLDDAHHGEARNSIAATCERRWRCLYICCCVFVFLGFLTVTLVGCWIIMCNSDD